MISLAVRTKVMFLCLPIFETECVEVDAQTVAVAAAETTGKLLEEIHVAVSPIARNKENEADSGDACTR